MGETGEKTGKERVTNHGRSVFPLPELPQYRVGTPLRFSLPSLQHFHFLCYEQRSKGPNFSLDFKKRLIRFQIPQNSAPQTPSGAEESVSSQAYQLAGFQPKPTQPSFQSQSHPSGFSLPRTEHSSKREERGGTQRLLWQEEMRTAVEVSELPQEPGLSMPNPSSHRCGSKALLTLRPPKTSLAPAGTHIKTKGQRPRGQPCADTGKRKLP